MNGLAGSQYAAPGGMAANQPRELGVLVRVDGVASGLHELHQKLTTFAEKLAGHGTSEKNVSGHPHGPHPHGPGLTGVLSNAESQLRECHQIVDALHQAF